MLLSFKSSALFHIGFFENPHMMRSLRIVAEEAPTSLGAPIVMVITSGRERVDGRLQDSYHYQDLAYDIRITSLTKEQQGLFHANLAHRHGSDYDVLLKKNHIHIEFDERRVLRRM